MIIVKDCHNNHFHTFKYDCLYDINLTNITNNEKIIGKISGKGMGLFELNKKLTVARQNAFLFNQINKLTKKVSNQISNKYTLLSQTSYTYKVSSLFRKTI